MISVENMVVDAVRTAVITKYPKAYITSDYVDTPSSFPCVSIVEADNYTYKKTQDDVASEHHAGVMYEINIFSNQTSKKKQEANDVAILVDSTLQGFKFTRTFKQPIPNKDKSIYRIVMRYEAVIGEGQSIGKNTIFQVYRK